MGFLENRFQTIKVRLEDEVCYIQFYRPEANNTLNGTLVAECSQVLNQCESIAKIVIFEGLPEVFCFGADFNDISRRIEQGLTPDESPEQLYELWEKIATGPYLTIAHVRGKTNAGGMGFVAACDIVLSETKAVFSLSELLFGLMPACVLPFLIRRIGQAKANYLTLMTQPINAEQAEKWGLVGAIEENSNNLLRKHLLRLRPLSKLSIKRYKSYMVELETFLEFAKPKALRANQEVFSDPVNLSNIARYISTGAFPWEQA